MEKETEIEVMENKKKRILLKRKSPRSIKMSQPDLPNSESDYRNIPTSQVSLVNKTKTDDSEGKQATKQYSNVNLEAQDEENVYDEPISSMEKGEKNYSQEANEVKVFSKKDRVTCGICVIACVIVVILVAAYLGLLYLQIARLQEVNQSILQNSIAIQNLAVIINNSLPEQFNTPGRFSFNPLYSCSTLPPSTPSDYYWVRASNGSAVHVYCDMTRSCGNITGGWMKVAELDVMNSSHQCPSGLALYIESNIRTCRRIEEQRGCSTVLFSTANIPYSESCGRVIAYQVGATNAFSGSSDINSTYVAGVSFTHGNPRQHIWTFAAGLDEVGTVSHQSTCPCNRNTRATRPPSFVGQDYFCEAGIRSYNRSQTGSRLYSNDPLWDGNGCSASNSCCSFNNPPWFYKKLPQPTADNIEMRVCRNEESDNEDIALRVVDIYVR